MKDRNACNKQIEILNNKISDLGSENKKLRDELAAFECRYNALLKELNECKEENNKCTSDLKGCRIELAAAKSKIDELQSRINELEKANKKCESELATLLCDADKFVQKITNTSEALTVVIEAAEGLNLGIQNEAHLFSGSHKLGCKQEPDCGCPK